MRQGGNDGGVRDDALGTPTEMVLVDRNKEKAMGEKLDLEHATSLLPNYVAITGTDDYQELAGTKLVVYTAGVAQAPGQTRLDLINTNKKILEENLPKIHAAVPEAIILIVANPVDVLTFLPIKLFPTLRAKSSVQERCSIRPVSVFTLGRC